MPPSFESDYPTITRWIKQSGRIEIGGASFADPFIQAVNRDGMFWGGKREYTSIDEALRDLERGIETSLDEQARTPPSRTGNTRRKTPRKPKDRADKDRPRSEGEQKVIKKVEKLDGIAEELRQGGHFSVTRLTTLKGLCEDPEAAGAFALFLARKIQERMREKEAPKRHRELVNRAVREMKRHLDDPTEERKGRLHTLLREIEVEQNEYRKIGWGRVRLVESMDLLVVEHALRAVLRDSEASFWLYEAARDYTGRTDELIPGSAPMVEEIAGFWRKRLGIKR